ncbi:sugar transporter [Vibrio parahaemolyticus]|nr:sugar transporter [Vibrio parahaemolyticus]
MSTEDFPVSAVCREAAVMVRRNLLAIVIACIPLIIVHSIFVFMYPEMTGQDQASVQEGNITGFYFVTIVLYPLVAAMAAVRVHRIYLVGDYMHSALDVFRLSAREFRFIGWWILFGLMMMLVIGIPIFVLSFIYIAESGEPDFVAMAFITTVASIPGYWVMARWSFVLPATAMDHQPRSLRRSWNQSRPYNKQVFILMGLIPLGAGLLSQLIFSHFTNFFMLSFVGVAYGIFGAYQLALLSLSYKTVVDIERARFDTPSEPPKTGEEFSA